MDDRGTDDDLSALEAELRAAHEELARTRDEPDALRIAQADLEGLRASQPGRLRPRRAATPEQVTAAAGAVVAARLAWHLEQESARVAVLALQERRTRLIDRLVSQAVEAGTDQALRYVEVLERCAEVEAQAATARGIDELVAAGRRAAKAGLLVRARALATEGGAVTAFLPSGGGRFSFAEEPPSTLGLPAAALEGIAECSARLRSALRAAEAGPLPAGVGTRLAASIGAARAAALACPTFPSAGQVQDLHDGVCAASRDTAAALDALEASARQGRDEAESALSSLLASQAQPAG